MPTLEVRYAHARVLILLAGTFVFGEHVGLARIAGTLLVVLGLIVVVRS